MIPITDKVQNQGDDKTVQPSSNSSVNANGHETAPKVVEELPSGQPESGFF